MKAEIKSSTTTNYQMSIFANDGYKWAHKRDSKSISAGYRQTTRKDLVYAFYSGGRRLKSYTARNIKFVWRDNYSSGLTITKSSSCN